ncbi:hypothetical protein WJX72_006189 [[Myrmecia] bisecta]|uniref:DNA mismatch repair proteins mutS family domain-containing protein n=1 Tax=[Myrmecia] bisecta TaxID=41462 RepID=A0AAW1R7H0_9CHLO
MDLVLFVRHGSFYNLFDVDADIGLRVGLNMSGRQTVNMWKVGCHKDYFTSWASRVLALGYSVGRIEEYPSLKGQGILSRRLACIYTPGTVNDGALQDCDGQATHGASKPLLAVCEAADATLGVCVVDVTLGRFSVSQIQDGSSRALLATLLVHVNPAEVVHLKRGLSEGTLALLKRHKCTGNVTISGMSISVLRSSDSIQPPHAASAAIALRQLAGFGQGGPQQQADLDALHAMLEGSAHAATALQIALGHLQAIGISQEVLPQARFEALQLCQQSAGLQTGHMFLDDNAILALELVEGSLGSREGSLLAFLDRAATAAGHRLVRHWITQPLYRVSEIEERLLMVEAFMKSPAATDAFANSLRPLPDCERLLARAANTLRHFQMLQQPTEAVGNGGVQGGTQPGGASQAGLAVETKTLLRLRLPSLTQAAMDLEAARKQQEQAQEGLLAEVAAQFLASYTVFADLQAALAALDVLAGFALATSPAAAAPGCAFTRPAFTSSASAAQGPAALHAQAVWHPLLMGTASGRGSLRGTQVPGSSIKQILPNNLMLGGTDGGLQVPSSMILSGANMGGKSTLLRSVCVAAIMAQLGCYVPAEHLVLDPVDRIFTRIGAQDRIVGGQSTFMIEMAETATLLASATPRSLLVLDELGRGTSTHDGYAIAYATLKSVCERLGSRTLFATHYHGLAEEAWAPGTVQMAHMQTQVDEQGSFVPLYRLQPGPAPQGSCGIEVAGGAGLPPSVLSAAVEQANSLQAMFAAKKQQQPSLTGSSHLSPPEYHLLGILLGHPLMDDRLDLDGTLQRYAESFYNTWQDVCAGVGMWQ